MASSQPGRDRPITPGSQETVPELGRHVHSLRSPNSCVGHLSPHPQGRATAEEDPMTSAPVFVGIDVSKARLDVACRPSGDRWAVANDQPGIALASWTACGACRPR